MLETHHTVLCLLLVILLSNLTFAARDVDYWDENYDSEKNCASQDLVEKINMENPDHCKVNSYEDPNESIEECKRSLTQEVLRPCLSSAQDVNKVGELLYCHNRARTTCCIHNFTCNDYKEVNENLHKDAKDFLTNKELFLGKVVRQRGYRNCYPTKGLDASKCADECKTLLKTSPLLDHCNKKGGLLKCCVRRDKIHCNECRFCCTLPFCSYKGINGEIIVEGEDILETNKVADQDVGQQAVYELRATNPLYKGFDNRCLKPEEGKPAEEWDHYDPDDFHDAITQEDLDKAKLQKFDKNFFNFEDPEVLRKFINPNDTSIWKKTYGFDFVYVIINNTEDTIRMVVETSKHCMRESQSKFGVDCKKDHALFKCCIVVFDLGIYIKTREHLYENKLIGKHPADEIGPGLIVGGMTYSCTKKDKYTGFISTKYKTPPVNTMGGTIYSNTDGTFTRIGVRNTRCRSMNRCNHGLVDLGEQFYSATTKKEICQLETTRNVTKVFAPGVIESMEGCMKRKSIVRICPKKILQKSSASPELMAINKGLREYQKKQNKKRKRKRKGKPKKGTLKKKKKKNPNLSHETSHNGENSDSKSSHCESKENTKPRTSRRRTRMRPREDESSSTHHRKSKHSRKKPASKYRRRNAAKSKQRHRPRHRHRQKSKSR